MRDIHCHLSGSPSTRVLWELIQESGYKTNIKTLEQLVEFTSLTDIKNLDSYLNTLHWIDKVQSSPAAVEKCTYDTYASAYEAGCRMLELRFNPTKRSHDGAIDLDKIIVAARVGFERARSIFGIDGGIILCLGWDCSDQANLATFRKALAYVDKGVIGIDIAGPYQNATEEQREDFVGYFEFARKSNLITTCHAGEISHPGLKRELEWTVNELKPDRIGHGIKLVEFPELITIAADRNTIFEICISSNLASGAVSGIHDFYSIFQAFRKFGVTWEMCTDATALLKTNINREHQIYQDIIKIGDYNF